MHRLSEKVNILRIGGFSFYYFMLASLDRKKRKTQTFFMKYEIKKNVFFTIHNLKIGDRIKRRDTII